MRINNKTYILNAVLSIVILIGMVGVGASGYFFGAESGLLGSLIGIASCIAYGVSYLFLSNSMGEGKALMGVVLSLILWYVVFLIGMAKGEASIREALSDVALFLSNIN